MPLDAIVVLGCRCGEHGQLSGSARRRVERAARAYADGLAPLVIASGGKAWFGSTEARAFGRRLIELGVAAEHLVREEFSQTTLQNARYVARIARARKLQRLGIVTCDWHMRRALAAFEYQGLKAEPVPAPSPNRTLARQTLRFGLERIRALADRVSASLLPLDGLRQGGEQ
jgi:uncharacterized SAM-binding protein YcdF (DUF218 family)